MTGAFRKSWAIFSIYFQDGIAYRASGLIWILTDVTTAVTMPLVWAHAANHGMIAGYSTSDFVLYYLCLLLLGSFITSHILWDVAMEIKEGQFSTALLRPYGFFELTFFRNLSWRVIRTCLFAPFFLLFLFLYRSHLGEVHVFPGIAFFISLILGHLVSFVFAMALSTLALVTQEAMAIFELYYFPMLFLSGQLFPISMLPPWAKNLAMFFPFYFTTGAPTEILIGRVSGHAVWNTIAMQVMWVTIGLLAFRLFWKKGLKHYSGVGM